MADMFVSSDSDELRKLNIELPINMKDAVLYGNSDHLVEPFKRW